jgi:hypothetical protein
MTAKPVAFTLVTAPVVVAFLGSGLANLLHAESIVHDMAHLGYPGYVSGILGVWKILGGLTVAAPALPRVKEWAYAGMVFDLTGAAISRGVMGDGARGVVPPLAIAALVVASWWLRPPGRVLAGAHPSAGLPNGTPPWPSSS